MIFNSQIWRRLSKMRCVIQTREKRHFHPQFQITNKRPACRSFHKPRLILQNSMHPYPEVQLPGPIWKRLCTSANAGFSSCCLLILGLAGVSHNRMHLKLLLLFFLPWSNYDNALSYTPRAFQLFSRWPKGGNWTWLRESERIGADPIPEGVAGTKVILVTHSDRGCTFERVTEEGWKGKHLCQ
jgi:hypothetical protein